MDDRKQAERRPFDPRVVIRSTDFQLPPAILPPQIQEIYTRLAEDRDRDRLLVEDVVEAVAAGRNPVVLTERRKHVNMFAEMLSEHLPGVVALMGGEGRHRAGGDSKKRQVIVSTGQYLGEGFDDDRLDTLFLALPVSWRGTLAQYAGRLHRLREGKKDVVIYDYVDVGIPMLARMHERRQVGYRALGYEMVALSGGQLSFGRL